VRRIFGPKGEEVTEECRKLHNEELNDLYCSSSILRVIKSNDMKLVRHVARMRYTRGIYRIFVGKPEGKRPPGRHRRGWDDNITMDLQEVGLGGIDWIELAKDRDRWQALVTAVMNLRVPYNAGNFLTSCKPVSFSRRTLLHGISKYTYFWGRDAVWLDRYIAEGRWNTKIHDVSSPRHCRHVIRRKVNF
jgi:hypothetical protein